MPMRGREDDALLPGTIRDGRRSASGKSVSSRRALGALVVDDAGRAGCRSTTIGEGKFAVY